MVLGAAECDAWAAYYRREWRTVLTSAVRLVRLGFGMSWPRTVLGAWWVLRANQVWAPHPVNDPDRAREFMRRFYALVVRDGQLSLDPVRAARLEVEWWGVHRARQREGSASEAELVDVLVELYAYTYQTSPESVRAAAEGRVLAMRHSDEWVAAGCRLDDPLLVSEREALVGAYAALLAAVRR